MLHSSAHKPLIMSMYCFKLRYLLLHAFIKYKVDTGNSILSELTKSEMSKKIGHFGYNLMYKDKIGELHIHHMFCEFVKLLYSLTSIIRTLSSPSHIHMRMHRGQLHVEQRR